MSRAGYSDDYDNNWQLIIWRGAVAQAIRGRRGQAFLREMLTALDAMEDKRLISDELVHEGEVCAIGAVGLRRGVDMSAIDVEDYDRIANTFGIAPALAREIMYENDEAAGYWVNETPEKRYERVRAWVVSQIKKEDETDVR